MAPVSCTTLMRRRAALHGMAGDAAYRYRSRDDERGSTFGGIRHHPMTTFDLTAHVLKRMWDLEAGSDGGPRSAAGDKRWAELRAHIDKMLRQAIEHLPYLYVHSVHAEWMHERGDAPGAGGAAEKDGGEDPK